MTIQLFDLVAEYIDNLLLYALSIKKDLDKEHVYFLSGARNHFFKLEAACRYLREIDNEKVFDEYYDIFKEAEDQLGQYDHHFALLSEIRKIGKQWPAKVIDHFEDQHKSSAKKLENYLEKEEWMQQNPPHLIRFIEKLKQMESISGEDFMAFMRAKARSYGRDAGFTYAEAFNVARTPGVLNLFDLV